MDYNTQQTLFAFACSSVAVGFWFGAVNLFKAATRAPSDPNDGLIYAGPCRGLLWELVQHLETELSIQRPSRVYPLSRYKLELAKSDVQRGFVSATFEFVEKHEQRNFLGWKSGPRPVFKRFGFIWMIEEVMLSNRVELEVTLTWKDLTPGLKSFYEEVVVKHAAALTRETVQRLNAMYPVNQIASAATPPFPAKSANAPWAPPPPSNVQIAPPGPISNPAVSSAAAAQQPKKPAMPNNINSRIQTSSRAFANMSKSAAPAPSKEQTKWLIEWPSPQDYHEAIQNPHICFDDFRLKEGTPEADALGMPRVSSGAFASVYRIRCRDGERAVRCFLHPVSDQQFRYEALLKSVRPDLLPWTVGYEYLSSGIRVGGQWYPVLCMDWVEGIPLNTFVENLCYAKNSSAIESLRIKFSEMIAGLSNASVAHGDLQHGNILVRDGQLVLVDYDGMFVPGLRKQASNELGHPNYQHPRRAGHHFDERIDRFSAWVIDTALLCLREDPTLWRYSLEDGESLLFHRHDFAHPDHSTLFSHLCDHASTTIRDRASFLNEIIQLNVDQIPELEIASQVACNESASTRTQTLTSARRTSLPDWLSDVD